MLPEHRSSRNLLDAWESSRPMMGANFNRDLRSQLLLTSSTTDLKTDYNSLDSRDDLARKTVSTSALSRRNRLLTSSNTPTDLNSVSVNSRLSDSVDGFSRNPDQLSAETCSRHSDMSSLKFRGRAVKDNRSNRGDATSRRDFFAHRPVQTSTEKNDAFIQRLVLSEKKFSPYN